MDISSECKVHVSANSCDLVVKEKMVDILSDVDLLYKHWRSKDVHAFPPSSPTIMGFHRYFFTIRKREDEDIFTTAIIPLPFPVQKSMVSIYKLGNEKEARVNHTACHEKEKKDKRKFPFYNLDCLK